MMSRMLANIFGMMNEEFKSEMVGESIKAAVSKQLKRSFPYKQFSNLLGEMNVSKKKELSIFINIQLHLHPNKPFPDEKFATLVLKKSKNHDEKVKVFQGIINYLLDIYEGDNLLTAEHFLASEEEITKKMGPWHFYWGLLLLAIHDVRIENRLSDLEIVLQNKSSDVVNENQSRLGIDIESKEAALVARERELRTKAEQELVQLKSKLRTIEKTQESLNKELEKARLRNEQLEQQLNVSNEAIALEKKKSQSVERNNNTLNISIKRLEKTNEDLLRAESSLREKFKTDLSNLQGQIQTSAIPESAERIIDDIRRKSDESYTLLMSGSTSREDKLELQDKLTEYSNVIDCLKKVYVFSTKAPEQEMRLDTYSAISIEPDRSIDQSDLNNKVKTIKYPGTFYRKDHGGYVILESNEQFSITESMVNTLNLEHEAEVDCEPRKREDGSPYYHLSILLQGDNSQAPIHQYMGYVKLGYHNIYYCVDMNDPELRFPLHEKDFEMQQPNDGDPCLFNVAVDGEYARISKLYKRTNMDLSKEVGSKGKSVNVTTTKRIDKKRLEPFLEGCRVVVLGGQAKWFESVVIETGAEYYHENGESPERIHPKLRKADALFILETSTSHEGSWSCIDIAKQNDIRHYKIEGSKSNLRNLLWDNRDEIRKIM